MSSVKVKCEVCGGEYKYINYLHLKLHDMAVVDYRSQFPDAPLQSEGFRGKVSKSLIGNMRGTANRGKKRSEESRKKMSASAMGNKNALGVKYKYDEEFGAAVSKRMMGNKNAKGKKRTAEQRHAMSERMKRTPHNSKGFNGRGIRGYFFSPKLNCEVYYQSSYELLVFQILDCDDNVEYYIPHPFRIKYDCDEGSRKYIPDILVFVINGSMRLIEVKAKWALRPGTRYYHRNRLKFEAARRYCEVNNMIFEVWTENEIRKAVKSGGGF